jgi:hypothetical protein
MGTSDSVTAGRTTDARDTMISRGRQRRCAAQPLHPGPVLIPREAGTPAAESKPRRESRPPRGFWQGNGPGCDPFFQKTLLGDAEMLCPKGRICSKSRSPKGPLITESPKTSSGTASRSFWCADRIFFHSFPRGNVGTSKPSPPGIGTRRAGEGLRGIRIGPPQTKSGHRPFFKRTITKGFASDAPLKNRQAPSEN